MNTLFTLVLIELLGEDSLANAFGWLNFFGGAGYILGPFIAGTLPSYRVNVKARTLVYCRCEVDVFDR